MGFCTNCGSELHEGDKFCFSCGTPVQVRGEKETTEQLTSQEKTPVTPEAPQVEGKTTQPEAAAPKKSKKWIGILIGFAVLGIVLFLIVVAVVCIIVFANPKKFETYENEEVCFSIDYPEAFVVTEPNANNVVFTNAETDMEAQLLVEYAYHTVGESAIYSAEDFVNQITADATVMEEWIGTDTVTFSTPSTAKIGSEKAYVYDISWDSNEGQLIFIDVPSSIGCYVIFWSVDGDSADNTKYMNLIEKSIQTFEITEEYESAYDVYDNPDLNVSIAIADENYDTVEMEANAIKVYVDSQNTSSYVGVLPTTYGSGDSVTDVMMGCAKDRLSAYEAAFVSNVEYVDFGRYDFRTAALVYDDAGETRNAFLTVCLCEDRYWLIEAYYDDTSYEAVMDCLGDVTWSFRVNDVESYVPNPGITGESDVFGAETPEEPTTEQQNQSSISALCQRVVEYTRSMEGYQGGDYALDLAMLDDFNQDGVLELITIYRETAETGELNVVYDIWTFQGGEALLTFEGVIYTEAGGMRGTLGIAEYNGARHLVVHRSCITEMVMDQYIALIPWTPGDVVPNSAALIPAESHELRDPSANIEVPASQGDYKGIVQNMNWLRMVDPLVGESDGVVTFDNVSSYAQQYE